MDKAVITERFLELIAGRDVLAALFTTYTFEPDFFELEIIPLLLNQEMAYSTDDRVKRFMVRENLREANLPIDVFYDLPMFRMSGDCSPEMEYLCNGVNLGDRAFHGKVSMILLMDRETGEEALLLGAGSNNLTRAGWWDNIECQHWEEVRSGAVPRRLVNILQEEIDFLNGYWAISAGGKEAAIDRIAEFVSSCKGSNSASPVYYYGLSFPENRRSFADFIHRKPSPLANYSNWTLEIISPFFADDAGNMEHEAFFAMGVDEIKLFLPFDSEGSALCQDGYYEHIQKEEGVQWAQWRDDVARALGLTGGNYRRLHAKVYHFYNKRQSWVFVGSVNFTYKAIHENIEAGFLAKLDKAGPLLEPIPDNTVIDKFAEPDEMPPGEGNDVDPGAALPELHLCYDWVSKRLKGRTSKRHIYEIEILGPEGRPVIAPWELRYKEGEYEGDTQRLETVLKNGSLVKVSGRDLKQKNKTAFPAHSVLLQQIGWSHKPLDLPELTATQILAIYAGMTPERRQMLLIDAKIRALVLGARGGELTTHTDDQIIDQFFCEYAEIFGAFSKLKKRLEQALDAEQYNQVDYYLTGTGVDSLPSLISRALEVDEEENRLNGVTCYLLLLSALEIYRTETLTDRPNVKDETKKLRREIQAIKKGKRLKLENDSQENRKRFFKWFEQEFFRVYTVVEDEA
ncbi:MAG TPA: hypothetical protein ENI62_06470 [Gammaproteobacteria bacterium]|nr:hypothetical protein [Gammaproteobacteria bacterium]